ncbi:MAG: SDR family NAD(P)-dependent oxidoreductase [Woeseiaceae bacterium]|nr:SDR family NAD(P)-dependent oxidoreductase [Woeseiaceae bacterium]
MAMQTPVSELFDLTGRTVLVTGASGNIGAGIARRLAEAGAHVIAHCRSNEQAARRLIDEIGRGDVVRADLSDELDVDTMFAHIRPDFVVNNAASQPVTALADMTVDDWRQVQASNVDSAFLVTQRAALAWRAAKSGGAIVNIASIEGSDPAAGHAHYASSKAALIMFTRTAALEYGPDNIRVNAVSPGLIGRDGLEEQWPEGVERWLAKAPLGRLGTPKDVADAVLFLLSPAARWISGINLVVDGGMSSQNKW